MQRMITLHLRWSSQLDLIGYGLHLETERAHLSSQNLCEIMSAPFEKRIFYRTRKSFKSRSEKRIMLAESQNWRCCWCSRTMDMEFDPDCPMPTSATVEHLIPIKYQDVFYNLYNGVYNSDNLVASCFECNNKRGSALVWNGIIVPELFELA